MVIRLEWIKTTASVSPVSNWSFFVKSIWCLINIPSMYYFSNLTSWFSRSQTRAKQTFSGLSVIVTWGPISSEKQHFRSSLTWSEYQLVMQKMLWKRGKPHMIVKKKLSFLITCIIISASLTGSEVIEMRREFGFRAYRFRRVCRG